jgi:hypothetical protein
MMKSAIYGQRQALWLARFDIRRELLLSAEERMYHGIVAEMVRNTSGCFNVQYQ